MKIDETLITTGIFQQELKNRFRCVVKVDDIDEVCYVSASCRLENFIDLHNKEVQLTPSTNSSKLQHTLFAVYKNNEKKATILNLSLANAVVFEQLHRRLFSFLGSRKLARREVLVEGYKADIFIEDTKTVIEIKTIIASSGQAIFPSVKSERGLKQLEQIKVLLEKGYRVCYMFVSLSPEVKSVVLDRTMSFYPAFLDCVNCGMCYIGYSLKIKSGEIYVATRIEVNL